MRFFVILFLALQSVIYAASSTKVQYQIVTEISASADTDEITLRQIIPVSEKGQQEVKVSYSLQPSRVFEDAGIHYAEWVISEIDKEMKLVTTIDAVLYKQGLQSIRKSKVKLSKEDREKYTSSEKWIESDNALITETLAKIRTSKSDKASAEKILKFVMKTMKYSGFNSNDQGALVSLNKKQGDCNDYTDLFIALCRAKGIPSRMVSGVSTNWNANDTPKHSRAEVFLTDYGWVPVDPLWCDLKTATFKKVPSILKFTTKRSDEILSDFYYWSFTYTGQEAKVKTTLELLKNSGSKKLPRVAEY